MHARAWHLAATLSLALLLGCETDASPAADAGFQRDATTGGARDAADPEESGPAEAGSDTGSSALRDAEADAGAPPLRVVLFSRTTGFRHTESIEAGRSALQAWGAGANAEVSATEDAAVLIGGLDRADVVVFLLTTGDVLDDEQQRQFESFVRAGGGFVGVHSAADTEYDWPFYGELVGAWFEGHPGSQPATLHVEAAQHPAAAGLPATWQRSDEWYNFRRNPRGSVDVIITLDEASYEGGTEGSDHPIAWSHELDKGRAIYTGLAHGADAWSEPLVRQHIQNALLWAGRRSAL
jgi:type 1 glutamine amidotransferase